MDIEQLSVRHICIQTDGQMDSYQLDRYAARRTSFFSSLLSLVSKEVVTSFFLCSMYYVCSGYCVLCSVFCILCSTVQSTLQVLIGWTFYDLLCAEFRVRNTYFVNVLVLHLCIFVLCSGYCRLCSVHCVQYCTVLSHCVLITVYICVHY